MRRTGGTERPQGHRQAAWQALAVLFSRGSARYSGALGRRLFGLCRFCRGDTAHSAASFLCRAPFSNGAACGPRGVPSPAVRFCCCIKKEAPPHVHDPIDRCHIPLPGSYDNVFEHASVRFDTRWKLGLTGATAAARPRCCGCCRGNCPAKARSPPPLTFAAFPARCPTPRARWARWPPRCAGPRTGASPRELGLLGLGPETLARRFDTLSQGEQTRALLALLFLQPGRLPADRRTDQPPRRRRARAAGAVSARAGAGLPARLARPARCWTPAATTCWPSSAAG